MTSHKLTEVEPESEFRSLPVSLASHLVLPVEWSDTGLLSSMVAHQIFQPCPENLEEIIPYHLSQREANELIPETEDLEESLRKDFKEWSNGVDFKATYCHFEEETTFAEDTRETLLMDHKDSMEIIPSETVPELVHVNSLDEGLLRENISEEVADEFLTEETLKIHITEDTSQEDNLPQELTKEGFSEVSFEKSQTQTHQIGDASMSTHKDAKPEREDMDYAEPEAWVSMVGHQVVGAEESDLPYASMAAHWSFIPEWKEEGTVSSGVSHQLLNQREMEEDDILKQNVPEKREETVHEDAVFEPFVPVPNQIPEAEREKDVSLPPRQLPYILEVEETLTEKHLEKGAGEAEDSRIRKEAEIDPRRRNIESASSSAAPKSPVGTSDDEKDSFENFINESKQTYHERVADEYKSTIKRIQDLQKLVEEEIGEFEKSKKDIKKSEVITVMSNVKGVSFPLEITINQKDQAEESPLVVKEAEKCQKGTQEQFQEEEESESEEVEGDSANIISASCTLKENTPILITTNRDQVECDSGFEGSPDLQKNDSGRVSKIDRDGESPVSFPKQTLTSPKRSSEEKKTREKQLLESFFKTENHGQGQIEDATRVTSNPAKRVTPEKKRAPGIPAGIPSRIAQEPKEAKKEKNRKPKVTTAEFKDSIMKKTYKIRFHVNLKESHDEKPRSVLQTFLSFFKDHSVFGKK